MTGKHLWFSQQVSLAAHQQNFRQITTYDRPLFTNIKNRSRGFIETEYKFLGIFEIRSPET